MGEAKAGIGVQEILDAQRKGCHAGGTGSRTVARTEDGTRIHLEEAGTGIRVDTGVSEGDTIPADFDSMIAKIIAYGRDRDEALGKLRRAMAETTVIIEGGTTNTGSFRIRATGCC